MRAVTLSILLWLVCTGTAALACNDESRETRVVGVTRDGRFVTRELVSYGGAEAGPTTLETSWSADGRSASEGAFSHGRYELTAPRLASTTLEVTPAADNACVVSARTPDGSVALTVVDFTSGANKGLHCSDVRATLWRHRHSVLAFVALGYASDSGGCQLDVTDVAWFPHRRIAAGQAYLRAMARSAEAAPGAVRALANVTRLDPGFLPARLALARRLAADGVTWKRARAHLSAPFPEATLPVFVAGLDEYLGAMRDLWDDPDYRTWLAAHERTITGSWGHRSQRPR